jgi:RimJ/RimL family protein N-acetyltransferase
MMIYGDKIRLRSAERQDIPQFVTWLNDPEVIENLMIYAPMSIAEEEDWFNHMLERAKDERPLVIEVLENDKWIMVGNCGIHNIDWRCRSAELGIFIGEKSFWNRGYGTAVMRLLIKYGFQTLNLNRLMLDVYDSNPRAIRTYEKAGFIHEGRKRRAMYKDGRYKDILIMSVLRDEWNEKDA